ncbi:hypothetical protein BC628DRAFT_1348342 [Trametes gibbosa]|nr:hypothetical protein BC628DRAFT_1348342 [Trametes gibbosa]
MPFTTASPGVAEVIVVDDSADSFIKYSPGATWTHLRGQDGVVNNTCSRGYTNATATIVFDGTDIALYGVALPAPIGNSSGSDTISPPAVRIVLDGIPASSTVPPYHAGGTTPVFGWLWFRESNLERTFGHTLQIVVDFGDSDWPFILDFIQYTPVGSSTTGTFTLTAPYSTGLAASDTGAPAASGSGGPEPHRLAVGPIVGEVIVGIFGLSLIVAVAFLWGRRRGRRVSRPRRVAQSDSEPDLTRPMSPAPVSTRAVRHLRDPPAPSLSLRASQAYPYSYPTPSETASLSLYPTEETRSTLSSPHSGSLDLVGIFLAPPSPTSAVPRPRAAKPRLHVARTGRRPPALGLSNVDEDSEAEALAGWAPPDDVEKAEGGPRAQAWARRRDDPSAPPPMGPDGPPVFHSDSGIRFAAPVVPPPARGSAVVARVPPSPGRAADAQSDVALPEVPPHYTER